MVQFSTAEIWRSDRPRHAPPRAYTSRLMWCIALWAYLVGLPRYLGSISLGTPEPLNIMLFGIVAIGIPACLIFTPIYDVTEERGYIQRIAALRRRVDVQRNSPH